MDFALKVELNVEKSDVLNYDQVKNEIVDKLLAI